jgi:hypothetical protein
MTWTIPSDREGHWNPAGLSLKSPRFLSNRWGPPHTSAITFWPPALMAKLLVSNTTVYQTAAGPGATGGGFDATGCGGVWAQAASKAMAPAAASWCHEIVRRDISASILIGSKSGRGATICEG